jgi:hypothetical protein
LDGVVQPMNPERPGGASGHSAVRYLTAVAGATLEKAERPEGLPSPRAFLAAKVADSQHRGPYRSVEWWCLAAAGALHAWRVANHEHNGALVQFLDPSRRSRPLQDVLPEVLTVLGAEMSELSERRELLAAAAQAKREEDTKQTKQFLSRARKHKSELVDSLWDVDDVVPTVGEFVDTYSPRLWRATRDRAWRAVNRNRVAPRRKADQRDEDGDAVVKSRPPKGLIDSTVIVEAINHERSQSESWSRLDFARDHSETLAVLLRHGADCVYRRVPSPVVDRLLWRVDMTGVPLEEPYWLNNTNIRLKVFVCATAWATAIETGSWARRFDERLEVYVAERRRAAKNLGATLTADDEEQARIKEFGFVITEFLKPALRSWYPEWTDNHLDQETRRYRFHVTYLLSQLCAKTAGMEQTAMELDSLMTRWRSGGGDD